MRLAVLLTALTASSVVVASPQPRDPSWDRLTKQQHYGAPVRPWEPHSKPGWYYGSHPERHRTLPCLVGPICKFLKSRHYGFQCPVKPTPPTPTPTPTTPTSTPTPTPPSDGYTQTFSDINGATQAGDYLTFGLVDTVDDCKAMCNSVDGCGFANTYHDVNGKGGSPQLTCSLFRNCHTAADATNTGGQTQPDGSVNSIQDSDGWCKI